MALLNTWSSANRDVEEDLCVTYSKTLVYGTWEFVSGTVTTTYYKMWNYVRMATKHYKYVGMTKSAADSCANYLRSVYLRTMKVSEWNPGTTQTAEFEDVDGGSMPMAAVVVSHVAGDMWQVDVNVNETDSRMRREPVAAVESLFATENARFYDNLP